MVVLDEIKESSTGKKPNSTMSVMLCIGATFVKKVARIVPFDSVDLHLLIFHILEPYPSKDTAFDLSHVIQINGIIIVHFKAYLNQYF